MSASWRSSSDWLRRARLTNSSEIDWRWAAWAWTADSSDAASSDASRLLRCCSSSVFFQKMITPMHAASTATPWIAAQLHGRFCAAEWLNMRSAAMVLPMPWDRTVNSTFQRNGTQSW